MRAEQVNAVRGVVLWVLRALAVALVGFGIYLAAKRVMFAIGSGDPTVLFRVWGDDLGESSSFYRGLSMIGVGFVIGLASRRVTRWVIALPPRGCPRCGHARAPGAAGDACPECGLPWDL